MSSRFGVVVAHGHLAKGLLSALENVTGPQDDLFVDVSNAGLGRQGLAAAVEAALDARPGREAVLFTDLEGGSCGHVSRRLLSERKVRAVFTGVNLPALVEFVFLHDRPFEEMVTAVVEKSRRALDVRR